MILKTLIPRIACFSLILFSISDSLATYGQSLSRISGKVTNESNEPLPGVTVVVKGTTTGTTTDSHGNYSLAFPESPSTLEFSFIGFQSQEITIGRQKVINVKMRAGSSLLKETVVIGYGSQNREDVTTSISKLDDKVLKNIPYSNAAAALEGTIPGLRVQTTSGQPGATPLVILRGGTSINNPNGATPLYVIDGVTRTNMNNINPNDIKSIQVLKDAAATAIYGARASNGVIIIVTKSGSSGKVQVNYSYDLTVSKVGKKYDLMDAKDFVHFVRMGMGATAALNPALSSIITGNTYAGGTGNDLTNKTYESIQYLTPDNAYKLKEGWESEPDPLDPSKTLIFSNTNWQNLLYRTAVSHSHNISISGGGDRATFRLGIGYQTDQGIAIQTDYKRLSLNLRGDLKISPNASVFGGVMYDNTSNHQVYNIANIFEYAVIQPPTSKLYFEDGTLSPGRNLQYSNPMYALSTYTPKNIDNDLTLIAGGKWEIIPGLSFVPQVSLYQYTSYSRNFQKAYWNGVAVYNTARNASGSFSRTSSPQANAVLTYDKTFNGVHNFELLGGMSYVQNDTYSLGATGNGASTDLIPTLNASAIPVSVTGSETQQKLIGYFSRLTYNYKQKYLVNASLRYDGASNLGTNNKWGLFPGISAGWRLDKENFWSAFPENLLQLKLRASYGVNGNISGLGLYQSQGEFDPSSQQYADNGALTETILPNPDLKWEQSQTLDFGMDLGILNSRIALMVDVYRRVTKNLLTTLSMPPTTGFTSILTNYGSLQNKGLEIEITAQVFQPTSAFQWAISLNAATVDTKILKLPPNGIENNRVGGAYVWDNKKGTYEWKGGLQEGGRIGDKYGYKQVSVYATDEEAAKGPYDTFITRANKTKYGGDVNWLDADRNDTIDSRDQVYMGNPYPRLTGGVTNSFSYKNINLSIRTDYTVGATVYYELGARLEGDFSGSNAISSDMLKSWQKQGDKTNFPRFYWADQDAQWNVWDGRPNSRFFKSTDFLCIREVTLSYDLPLNMLNKYKIAGLSFHVTGNNLYYFTGYPGLSPEQTSTDAAYPNPVSLIFGASITF